MAGLIGLILTIFLVAYLAINQSIQTSKHCAKWENKIVHQRAYTTYMWSGKVMIPIHHPARNYERRVCTQPK